MYSVNGVALQDATRGWRILRAGSQSQGGVTNSLNKVKATGFDGYFPAPYTFTEQVIVFVIRCPRAELDALLTLLAAATKISRTGDSTKEAYVQLASAIPSSDAPLDAHFDVTATFMVYQGVWRDVTTVDVGPTSITSPTQTFTMLSGISAPISDMNIFIRGVFGQFTLTDSGGSFLKTNQAWPGTSSTGLLYTGASGQAFFADESSPWVPVTDASQYVDTSGNGGFKLTPQIISNNPDNRQVSLSLTTLTQTSTTLRVQAKRAYRMN